MATFPLNVRSMKGTVYQGEVLSLTVPTEKGPLMIEPGYTNFMGAISSAGVMKIVEASGKPLYYAIFGGVVDVRRGVRVDVFSEELNFGYEIDLARAIASRDRNLDRLNSGDPGIDILRAKAKLAKALVRINAKELSEGSR